MAVSGYRFRVPDGDPRLECRLAGRLVQGKIHDVILVLLVLLFETQNGRYGEGFPNAVGIQMVACWGVGWRPG